MGIVEKVYIMRKRINEKSLLKLQKIIDSEVERRLIAEKNSKGMRPDAKE